MTLVVTIHVKDGIVMASDSRISFACTQDLQNPYFLDDYRAVNRMQYSDDSQKLYVTENGVGISTFGEAKVNNDLIVPYIETFVKENASTSVEDIAQNLITYFTNIDEAVQVGFHVSGYMQNRDKLEQRIYRVNINGILSLEKEVTPIDCNVQGALWDGRRDILDKLTRKYNHLYGGGIVDTSKEERSGYDIPWDTFTIEMAIDFAKYAIKTTIKTLDFQMRPKIVGGPIDILVIRPDGYEWIAKKETNI